jgi:ATP synthase protein I
MPMTVCAGADWCAAFQPWRAGSIDFVLPHMSESQPPDRLARLAQRLNKARAAAESDAKPRAGSNNPTMQRGMALGLRIGLELVVAVMVATLVGWGIDRWLGTAPWVSIAMFFLGVAAGMVNVYRAVAGIQTPVGVRLPDEIEARGRADRDKWDEDED